MTPDPEGRPRRLESVLEQLRRDALESEKAGHFSTSFRLGYDSALMDVRRCMGEAVPPPSQAVDESDIAEVCRNCGCQEIDREG